MDDAEKKWVEMVGEGLVTAQGVALANQFILMEVVRMLARHADDPHRMVADLFERVMARMDQQPLDQQGRPASAFMRESVERFFVNAGREFSRRGD